MILFFFQIYHDKIQLFLYMIFVIFLYITLLCVCIKIMYFTVHVYSFFVVYLFYVSYVLFFFIFFFFPSFADKIFFWLNFVIFVIFLPYYSIAHFIFVFILKKYICMYITKLSLFAMWLACSNSTEILPVTNISTELF